MRAPSRPKHTPGHFDDLVGKLDSASSRLEQQLKISLQAVATGQKDAKEIASVLKTINGDLAIIRAERDLKVSLLYKRMSGTAYIKGRCWWRGKQREVQIGTIPAVLKKLATLVNDGHFPELPGLDDLEMTWEQVLGNEPLVAAIKALGQNRLRQYVIERLQSELLESNSPADQAPSNRASQQGAINKPLLTPDAPGMAWYEEWRQINVGATS